MDLDFSEEQQMLMDMSRRLCEDHAPLSQLRQTEYREPGFDPMFFAQLREHGLTGMAVSETRQGLGLGIMEVALVQEQLGRHLAVSPHLESCIIAVSLLEGSDSERLHEELLPALASGESICTVADLEPGGVPSPAGTSLDVTESGAQLLLNGAKHFVPFAGSSDWFLITARNSKHGFCIVLVDACARGVELAYQPNLAGEPLYKVTLSNVEISTADCIAAGAAAESLWKQIVLRSLIPRAARLVGAGQAVHELAIAYSRERVAFGRPIGGFQAIAHYLADIDVLLHGARTLVYQAAWYADEGLPFYVRAAMAQLQAGEYSRRSAAVAMQVHGGFGYTLEADPQLYFRRIKQWQLLDYPVAELERIIGTELLTVEAA